MTRFIKKIIVSAMMFIGCDSLKCVSMNDRKGEIIPAMMNINSNEPIFYPYIVHVNKCSGNCNDINYPNVKLCVPDVTKDVNMKVFNLMLRTNQTCRHETCACKWSLHPSVCNVKQRWNSDKCRCECKEYIDECRCDDGFIWNPSICECECDKSCGVGEYLNYANCKCKKAY